MRNIYSPAIKELRIAKPPSSTLLMAQQEAGTLTAHGILKNVYGEFKSGVQSHRI